MKVAQEEGHKILYVETDYKLIPERFEKMGVDFSKVKVIQEQVGEKVLIKVMEQMATGKYALVVIDTVSKVTPQDEIEKPIDDPATIGKQAVLIGRFLRKLKPLANQHNVAVLLLNHEREKIDTYNPGRPKITVPGGKAITEDVVFWLRLRPTSDVITETIHGEKQIVGKNVVARVWKNQISDTEKMEFPLTILFNTGYDDKFDLLETALARGVITAEGSHYFLDGEKLCYGKPKLQKMFEDESFRKKIEERV